MEVDLEDTEATMEGDEHKDKGDLILDSGKTMDDMRDHRSGISTPQGVFFPIHCLTQPIASVNPLSTFSPIVGVRCRRTTRVS